MSVRSFFFFCPDGLVYELILFNVSVNGAVLGGYRFYIFLLHYCSSFWLHLRGAQPRVGIR